MKNLIILTIPLLFSGCFFAEKCLYSGELNVIPNWEHRISDTIPDSIAVYVFGNTDRPFTATVGGPTSLGNFPSSTHEILSVSPLRNTGIRNLHDYRKCEIIAAESHIDGIAYIEPTPLIYGAGTNVDVPAEGSVKALLVYRPIVKTIHMKMRVTTEVSYEKMVGLATMITGTATGYSLYNRRPLDSNGTLFLRLKELVPMKEYQADFHVFGFVKNAPNQPIVPKEMTVVVSIDNGFEYRSMIDLTDQFDAFNGDVLTMQVEITIESTGISIHISEWKEGLNQSITIK